MGTWGGNKGGELNDGSQVRQEKDNRRRRRTPALASRGPRTVARLLHAARGGFLGDEMLDLTSLTEVEFESLVVPFEQAFQTPMAHRWAATPEKTVRSVQKLTLAERRGSAAI